MLRPQTKQAKTQAISAYDICRIFRRPSATTCEHAVAVLVDHPVDRREQLLAGDVALPELLGAVHWVHDVVRLEDLLRDDVELVPATFIDKMTTTTRRFTSEMIDE